MLIILARQYVPDRIQWLTSVMIIGKESDFHLKTLAF